MKLMKPYFNVLLIAILGFVIASCKDNDSSSSAIGSTHENEVKRKMGCQTMQTAFSSYDEAKQIIRRTEFKFTDQLGTGKSSWIQDAYYYSCDERIGYFLLVTQKKDYIFQDMPLEVWHEFINTPSHGSYFISNIKGRYQFVPTK